MNEEFVLNLYNYLSQPDVDVDGNFASGITSDDFAIEMQNPQYAAQIYNYLGTLDSEYKLKISVDDFLVSTGAVKKKEEPTVPPQSQNMESPSEVGGSELLEPVQADAQQGRYSNIFQTIDANNKKPPSSETSYLSFLQDEQAKQSRERETQMEQFGKPPVRPSEIDLSNYQPTDIRETDYISPITRLSKEGNVQYGPELDKAYAQYQADVKFTAQNKKNESPAVQRLVEENERKRQEEVNALKLVNEKVVATPEFQSTLDGISKEVLDVDEMDAVKYLNDLLGPFGFTTRTTSKLGDEVEIREVNGNTEVVNLNKLDELDISDIKDFVTTYALEPSEAREALKDEALLTALKAKNLRYASRINPDGTESSVMFESAVIGDKNVVYPTLFPKDPLVYSSNPSYWTELSGNEAYGEALRRGEVFEFDTPEEAEEFAKGSWKEVHSADYEADKFFKEKGYDFFSLKKQFEKYEDVRNTVDFLDKEIFRQSELTPEEQLKYDEFYTDEGLLRTDIKDVKKKLKEEESKLRAIYTDDDLQELREEYDVYIDKKYQQLNQNAIRTNAVVQYVDNELNSQSIANFGVGIEELKGLEVPEDKNVLKDSILTAVSANKELSQLAANRYEIAQTFLDVKYDKDLRGEIVDNWAAFYNSAAEGLARGQAGNEVLKMSLGLVDMDDKATTSEIAMNIVKYLDDANTGKTSRAMYRWHSAKGFFEAWDAFADNPIELATSFAANSISQMLPYGYKIIPAMTLGGAATGFAIGATAGGVGAIPGTLTGIGYGLRSGFVATMYALEYTNSFFEIADRLGYDLTNAQDVLDASNDQDVWSQTRTRGLKRGVPIAIMDWISMGLAGRVFSVGKTANFGTRAVAFTGERVTIDPLFEAGGEFLAQVSSGEGIEFKEIVAEALGGIGQNGPMAAFNIAMDTKMRSNLDIANDLTTVNGILNETSGVFKPSLSRVSKWANNMQKLGQIGAKTNQRIQENLGLIKDVDNVFAATEGRASTDVKGRMMELMAAKQELESSTNRKEIFREKINEINQEIAELAETKKLRPEDQQTFLQVSGIPRGQATQTDMRTPAAASYKIDDKVFTRIKFLNKVADMSEEQFKKSVIVINNDDAVADILIEKFGNNAVQKQETRTVSEAQQTEDIQEVDETVREVQEQTAEPETTQEIEEVKGDRLATNQPITINYNRNLEPSPDMGEQFGQDVEAAGIYITQKVSDFTPEGLETGSVQINNPLVIDVTTDTQIEYKRKLSEENEGKTGVELSNALKEKGFDAIVTKNEDGTTGEIVLLNDISTYKVEQPTSVAVETETETEIPTSITRVSQADAQAYNNNTMPPETVDGILAAIADKVIAGKKLTPFQNKVQQDNQERVDELVSLKTQQETQVDLEATITEEIGPQETVEETTVTEEAVTEEVASPTPTEFSTMSVEEQLSDLEAQIVEIRESNKNRATKAEEIKPLQALKKQIQDSGKPIRTRLKDEVNIKEGAISVDEIVEEMNTQTGTVIDMDAIEETEEMGPKIDIDELNSRVDNPIPTVAWKVIDGVPVIFSISDQLTTGDTVNPYTGNVIKNLKGGAGFNGIEGHQNIAWASVDGMTVKKQQSSASTVYQQNKEFFDNWWKQNPQYNGLVPMVIVKMGSDSILSNEAVVRVLADNLKSFPRKNKAVALREFKKRIAEQKKRLKTAVSTGLTITGRKASAKTIKRYKETIGEINDVQNMIKEIDAKTIDELLSPESLGLLKGIKSVNIITQNIGYSKNSVGKSQKPGTPGTPVAKALMEGLPIEDRAKLHLGSVTDVITEPQLKNTPQRAAFAIVGIDVLNPSIEKTNHPNYPVGPKGKIIGLVEQPQSIIDLFPSIQNNIALSIESESQGITQPKSKKQRLMQVVPVQVGLSNVEFIGSRFGVDNVGRFLDFLNRSMPFVSISTDNATMNQLLESSEFTPYLKNDEVIYGMTTGRKIFINGDVHNSNSELFNTAIHEMGHIWTETIKLTKQGQKIYDRGAKLVKETNTYKRFLKKYNGNVDRAVDETMATLIGNKGESVVQASLKQKIKDWIAAVWTYVKTKFKLSKDLTIEEIQDLTLDEFLETAVADILSGKPIKLSDNQLQTLDENLANILFRTDDRIFKIVDIARRNGFNDRDIRKFLKQKGFSNSQINDAMIVKVDLFTDMPTEFSRVEGGVEVGMNMFNDIKIALSKFATDGKAGIIGTKRIKAFADIRQKAQDLLMNHPTYKKAPDQTQLELRSGLDRVLGIRANPSVTQDISQVRETIRQRKVGQKQLQSAILQLKNYIRTYLPASKNYTQGQINNLISAVANTTVKNYPKQLEKVIKIVDQQRQKMTFETIDKIAKIVKKKSQPRKTKSKKNRATNIDATGVVIFDNISKVMEAVRLRNPDARTNALETIRVELEEGTETIKGETVTKKSIIETAIQKTVDNQQLTPLEERLMQLQLAYDQFSQLENATLEMAEAMLTDVENIRAEAILRLDNRRLEAKAKQQALQNQADEQLQETNPEFFNEDGSLKSDQEIADDIDNIKESFIKRKIFNTLSNVANDLFSRESGGLITGLKNMVVNLETLGNFLDRKTKKLNFFTNQIYDRIALADERHLLGVREKKLMIDKMVDDAGISYSYRSFYGIGPRKTTGGFIALEHTLNDKLGYDKRGIQNTYKIKVKLQKPNDPSVRVDTELEFNANQLLRIYALSKNDIQREKLQRMGIDQDRLNDIEKTLGKKLIDFADMAVDYLTNESYAEVNSVYRQTNNANLSFINNYFPTVTVQQQATAKDILDGDFKKIFSAEFDDAFKARTNITSDINLKEANFSDTFMNHVLAMERYKVFAQPVQDINNLFKVPSVKLVMDTSGLSRLYKTLLNAALNPDSAAYAFTQSVRKSKGGSAIDWFSNKFVGFALAAKLVQIPKQAISFINAFADYRYSPKLPPVIRTPIDLFMFTIDFTRGLVGAVPDLFGGKGTIAEIRDFSASFDSRIAKGFDGDLVGLESGVPTTQKQTGKPLSGLRKLKGDAKTIVSSPTSIGDIMGVLGYYAVYRRNIANGMPKEQAIAEFNRYNNTQQSRFNRDKSPIQITARGRNEVDSVLRLFTMFGSVIFLQQNQVMQSFTNVRRGTFDYLKQLPDVIKGKKTHKQAYESAPSENEIRRLAINFGVANAMFVGMANIMLLLKGNDEDRDLWFARVGEALMGLNIIFQVPVVGTGLEYAYNTYAKDKPRPVDDIVNPLTATVRKSLKRSDKYNMSELESAAITIAELKLGVQFDPAIGLAYGIGEELFDVDSPQDFDDNMYDLFGITPSYRPSYGQKKSKFEGVVPLGGIKNKSDLKRFNPDLYDKIYGKQDSIRKAQRELEKERLRKAGLEKIGNSYYPIKD